jgi:hypothetical protein
MSISLAFQGALQIQYTFSSLHSFFYSSECNIGFVFRGYSVVIELWIFFYVNEDWISETICNKCTNNLTFYSVLVAFLCYCSHWKRDPLLPKLRLVSVRQGESAFCTSNMKFLQMFWLGSKGGQFCHLLYCDQRNTVFYYDINFGLRAWNRGAYIQNLCT